MRPRSERRAQRWDTQRSALLAAAQRVIRNKGPSVSMDDIATEARVAKPILYRHFGDRAGLARAIGESVLLFSSSDNKEEMLQRMSVFFPTVDRPEDLSRVFQGFLGQFSAFVEMETDLYRFLQTEQALQRMMEGSDGRRLRSPIIDALARSFSVILKNHKMDTRAAEPWAHALVAMGAGAIDWWADNKDFSRFELERFVLRLAWGGLAGILDTDPATERSVTPPTTKRKRATRRMP